MLKYLFGFILFTHGLIHFMGFAKAYNYGNITQITKEVSKPSGVFWLMTAILFLITVLLFLLKKESWPYLSVVTVILSQILIITVWKDAKFGTVANIIVLAASIAVWGSKNFESAFKEDVKSNLQKLGSIQTDLLTEADINLLPLPVQKYLRYCDVLNKPKVKNMKVVFDGEMRDKNKDFFKFTSVQYNFFDEPARLFFMKGKMYSLIVPGYHYYRNATATMQIKLFGLLNVVNVKGELLNRAETVTVFNDMCLMAPASLIDKRIVWTHTDSLSAKAIFTNGIIKITATLYFNKSGQLINFMSDDRYAMDMKQYRFSTPVKNYTIINERKIWQYGEAIWHYPDGEFVYGKFKLKSIEYNVKNINE